MTSSRADLGLALIECDAEACPRPAAYRLTVFWKRSNSPDAYRLCLEHFEQMITRVKAAGCGYGVIPMDENR